MNLCVLQGQQAVVRPVSPRAALIRKLEHYREAKGGNQAKDTAGLVRHSNKPHHDSSKQSNKSQGQAKQVPDEKQIPRKGAGVKCDNREVEERLGEGHERAEERVGVPDPQSGHGRMLHSDANSKPDHRHRHDNSATKNDSVCSTNKVLARALSYTAMTETSTSQNSESEQELESSSDYSDSDEDSDEDLIVEESPTKIVTRKVAVRHDMLKADAMSENVLHSKSPSVISREKVDVSQKSKEETKFSYHSDTDSVGKKNDIVNDGRDPGSGEKKVLQFDDDEEWGEGTPQAGGRGHAGDQDSTLVEEPASTAGTPSCKLWQSKPCAKLNVF